MSPNPQHLVTIRTDNKIKFGLEKQTTIVSWNCRGFSNIKKADFLNSKFEADIICLQETHRKNPQTSNTLPLSIPGYNVENLYANEAKCIVRTLNHVITVLGV